MVDESKEASRSSVCVGSVVDAANLVMSMRISGMGMNGRRYSKVLKGIAAEIPIVKQDSMSMQSLKALAAFGTSDFWKIDSVAYRRLSAGLGLWSKDARDALSTSAAGSKP